MEEELDSSQSQLAGLFVNTSNTQEEKQEHLASAIYVCNYTHVFIP